MRILVHDFAGHPFPAELSRELARRGWDVTHAFCGTVTTGRGDLHLRADDPTGLRFVDAATTAFDRYNPIRRLLSELRYGRAIGQLLAELRPEVVLSSNTPLVAQALLWRSARRTGARRVYWVQDLLGRGTRAVLTKRSRALGATAGAAFERLEGRLLRAADAHVVIADDFVPALRRRGVTRPVTVVENWAPLDELERRPKRNRWSEAAGLADRPLAVYAGTLGLKHDPSHLVAAAAATAEVGTVLVVSEGLGRAALEAARADRGLDNLLLRDFVDYDVLPDVLGAADVCLVLLEADAAEFSVPSKVLSYLAAERPVVAAVPRVNLAARILERSGAGVVTEPGDHAAFAAAVRALLTDPARAAAMGAAGRRYAEEHFAIGPIADTFEAVLSGGSERAAAEQDHERGLGEDRQVAEE